MKMLRKWKARRSGSTITVEGIDCDSDRPVTLTGIFWLTPEDGRLIVRVKGQAWELSLDSSPRPDGALMQGSLAA